ncbi:hypothetical protein PV08_11479 [Exophiala spinifera]|uniref:3-hydroxyisobutyrate dehydrogenase n=1 Tax=Exophiala spinifera TaxID=91928 RepID=A0A0D2AVT4_9EURO|nr:uncharacterized protein PV08_11479 [Exophiala spinifera]KIW10515.1 hypothetical protein PV08_11479 [Exophiala spinifera]
MGFAMAGNIRKKIPTTSTLFIYDVHRPSCERFDSEYESIGPVVMTESVKDLATFSDVVISIVPTADNVRQVYLDKQRGLSAAPRNPHRLILECSTIESASTRDIGNALRACGHGHYVDAPVSGGVPAAEAGTLSFMIGSERPSETGSAEAISIAAHINEVLTMLGKPEKFFWCGGLGAGLAAKISNNYISCTFLLVIAEAMAMGIRNGIDPKLLQEVIHNSSGQSFMGDHVNPVPGVVAHAPSSNNWKLGFKTQMMIKDIGLGIDAAKQVGITPSMAEAAIKVWKRAAEDPRCIDRDGSSIWLHINDIKEDQ